MSSSRSDRLRMLRGVRGRVRLRRSVGSPSLALLIGLLALLASACSADETGDSGRDRTQPLDVAQFGNAAPAPSTTDEATPCEAGTSQSCLCPDGSDSGTQACMAGGMLGPCQGCRTGGAAAELSAPVVADGALCAELEGQGGCKNESFRSEELPASILFLIDRSGSMVCNPPEFGQTSEECEAQASTEDSTAPTKWEITAAALEQVFTNLDGSGASAGVAFLSTDEVCGVDSKPAVPVARVDSAQTTRMIGSLANVVPGGGTPLVGGTILAYAHLHEEAGLDASGGCARPPCGAPGNRFVVLITDGADSCPQEPIDGACAGGACTDFLLDQSAEDAVGVNIRTFVIGAPGSESARGFLSELALRGGTARGDGQCAADRNAASGDCHFDMTTSTDFAADLTAGLEAISGSAIGCEFPVPQPTDREPTDNVNVQYRAGGVGEPVCIGFDDRPCDGEGEAGANGWQFGKNADGSDDLARVVLCGDACRTVQDDAAVQVDVVLGCRPLLLE